MDTLVYILKMGYYLLFAIIMYAFALNGGQSETLQGRYSDNTIQRQWILIIRRKRLTLLGILLLCIMIGYYGIICGQIPIASDRGNYALRFSSDFYAESVKSSSLGLYFIEQILHMFSYEPNVLFFTIPFVTLLLYLAAYNEWEDITPFAILMLGMSPCVNYALYQFKQAPALGLMALSFAFYFKGKKFHSYIFLALAILFHESAWMMLPLLIVMRGSKMRWVKNLEIGFLIVCMLGFTTFSSYAVNLFSLIPGMRFQLQSYLTDSGEIETSSNFMTIIKGFPYYFITLVGCLNRENLKEKIKYYDQYLTMAVFASGCTLLSAYMYWMWRFGSYTYFPLFVFSSLLLREIDKDKNVFKFVLVLSMSFFTFRGFAQMYFVYGGY